MFKRRLFVSLIITVVMVFGLAFATTAKSTSQSCFQDGGCNLVVGTIGTNDIVSNTWMEAEDYFALFHFFVGDSTLDGDGLYADLVDVADVYSGSVWSSYAQIGDLDVTNLDVSGTKNFRIDHPLDPANRILNHSAVESDEMKNIYDGVVILDETGSASVKMPKWFDALNRDFRYQLTAIGGPGAGLYVAAELSDSQFTVAGGTPNLKVSWQVTGVREDASANKHRKPVEQDKATEDRGKYVDPAAFGKDETQRVGRKNRPVRPEQKPLPVPAPTTTSNEKPKTYGQVSDVPTPEEAKSPAFCERPHPTSRTAALPVGAGVLGGIGALVATRRSKRTS
jgi:hypothetical protein